MRRARPRRSERGQSFAEFTLILPVILAMVLGMIELGFAINNSTGHRHGHATGRPGRIRAR